MVWVLIIGVLGGEVVVIPGVYATLDECQQAREVVTPPTDAKIQWIACALVPSAGAKK